MKKIIPHIFTLSLICLPTMLLAADFGIIKEQLAKLDEEKVPYLHLDIMDGVFVPNISFGMPVLEAITKHTKKTIDVHLMIVNPDQYIKTFKELGAHILTVHYEACTHLHRTLQSIKAEGMEAGVALNPHTAVDLLEDIIQDIDMVCIMSVNPGFGGQQFIPKTLDKIAQVRSIIDASGLPIRLEVDGGVTTKNIRAIAEAGADTFVAGSAIFGAESYQQAIHTMREELAKVRQINV